jgi:prepilin peptidase CpaA
MSAFLIAAVVIAALAAVFDWRTGEIPNWLTHGALVVAPFAHVAHASVGQAPTVEALQEGGFSLAGALLCALVPLLLFRQNAIGGGDVKVLAAIGAILQPKLGVEAEMYAFFGAAIVAPARLAYEGKLFRTLKNAMVLLVNPFLPKDKRREVEQEAMSWFRFGPAVFVGTALAVALNWRLSR